MMMNDNGFEYISNKDETREKLQHLIQYHKFTLKSLSKIFELDCSWLTNFLDGKVGWHDLPNMDRASFLDTISMLSDGIMSVNEDTRIKAVIDVLGSEFEITYETIAVYAGIELEELQRFMTDPNSISYEKRYKLSTTSLFLHYLFKKPLRIL